MFHSSSPKFINMKLMKTKRVMMLAALCMISTFTRPAQSNVKTKGHLVSATKYHPVRSQCSGNPLVTADGSKISLTALKSGKLRWIAVSRDLLKNYSFGDTVRIISDDKRVSGRWVIHDTMSPRHKMKIDFLVHPQSSHSIPQKVTMLPV